MFCERCAHEALVSDGSPGDVFKVFNQAFPTATPKKVKREIWRLAERVAAKEITASEALDIVSPEGDAALKGTSAFWLAVLSLMVALVQVYQGYQADRDAERDHAELMGVLGQIQSTLAATAQDQDDVEPSPQPASGNTPLLLRGRSDDVSKPRKRAAKSRRKK